MKLLKKIPKKAQEFDDKALCTKASTKHSSVSLFQPPSPFPTQLIIIASAYKPLDRKKTNTALIQVASRVEIIVRSCGK